VEISTANFEVGTFRTYLTCNIFMLEIHLLSAKNVAIHVATHGDIFDYKIFL
jgi:hypothetical protein